MTTSVRPTVAVVEEAALRHNIRWLSEHVEGRPIMAVVKANAYGHGLVPTSRALLDAGVQSLGVAFLEEGLALRRAGIRAPVLVLGGIIGNQIRHFLEHDLMMAASSPFKIQQIEDVARALGKTAQVHLAVDTGMGRIGVQWDTAAALFEAAARACHLEVRGVFSHLADAESEDPSFTRVQLERFSQALRWYEDRSLPTPLRHLANSAGVLAHPSTWLDLVRPGISLYGVPPCRRLAEVAPLQPALSLFTRVVYFKVVRRGRSVSYDRTWTADQDTRVVTLPVGYGDGYPRRLSNRGHVFIRGERWPVIGRVTMDAIMVSLGADGTAYNGDVALLLGRFQGNEITALDLADQLETIPYEVLTQINTRVPRVHLPPDRVVDPEVVYRATVQEDG